LRPAFDLPTLFRKPCYEELVETLFKLRVEPLSWKSRHASVPQNPHGQQTIARYLSTLTSNSLHWLPEEKRENVWELASICLSDRCGRSGAGSRTRAWEISPDLKLEIHEPPLTGDNLGFKTWGSAYRLAKRLRLIGETHLVGTTRDPILRVLELGSGTGLVGLAAAAIWRCMVYLTDLPDIVDNLLLNVHSNCATVGRHGGTPVAGVLDWTKPPAGDIYSVIIASDPLYSVEHPQLLGNIINGSLLNDLTSRVVMELPLRDAATRAMRDEFCSIMESYGFGVLEDGMELGYDDWEQNGESTEVEYWWGIWGRKVIRMFED